MLVKELPPKRPILMPLDYKLHYTIGRRMLTQESKRKIGTETYPAHRERILRNYSGLPKAMVDATTEQMKKRVADVHKVKGGYTTWDLGGNSKSREPPKKKPRTA